MYFYFLVFQVAITISRGRDFSDLDAEISSTSIAFAVVRFTLLSGLWPEIASQKRNLL
jgi:hypothetical protein